MALKLKKKTPKDDLRRRVNDTAKSRSNSFSYHSRRSANEVTVGRTAQYEQAKKSIVRKTKFVKNLPGYLAVLVVLGSLFYATTLNSTPKITVEGNPSQSFLQPIDVYQQAAAKLLSNSMWSGDKLTIDTDKVESQMRAEFPELSGVSVVIPLLSHQADVEIIPSQSSVLLSNTEGKFLVSEEGVAILRLTTAQQADQFNLPVVTDDSGLKVVLGEQILSTSSLSFINAVIDQFEGKSISIESITLSTVPYELDVKVRGVAYYIKFNLLDSADYEIGTYLSTIKYLGSSLPSQYIDVRIPGRAYYK